MLLVIATITVTTVTSIITTFSTAERGGEVKRQRRGRSVSSLVRL